MLRRTLTAILFLPCFACACTSPPQGVAAHKLLAFVTIPPQAFLVKAIGGERVAVDVMVPAGQSPHAFEPTPQQIAALSDADVYFEIGEAFEKQLVPKIVAMNPRARIVDTREGIALRPADNSAHPEEAHGVVDPHIWLAPKLAKIQARTIARTLGALDPAHRPEFEQKLTTLEASLDAEDAKLAAELAPLRGKDFFVYHPSFGYFADAYGLRQVPVEIAGKEPSAKEMGELIDRAKAEHIKVIFVAPQFSEKSARAVAAAIGGAVVRIDPLSEDYLANLDDIATKIRDAIAHETP
jgi:zinc transport system substrate-binding protein